MWGAIAALLLCADAAGQGPFVCATATGSVTPTVRAEGLTERVGDIVLVCSGGAPLAAGTPLPQISITLFLNTAVTSRIQDVTTGASEALLVIDDAGGTNEPSAPTTQLACGTPVTGCSITANGGNPYDGAPGQPNVFEGIATGNTVAFYGVPIQPPGYGSLTLRFVNIRVNANGIAVGQAAPGQVSASIAVSGGPAIMNSTLAVAFVLQGLGYQTRDATDTVALSGAVALSPCVAGTPCRVATLRFGENFATAFRVQSQFTEQNIPDMIYNSESGFFNTALASSNPNLATAGVADAGTRFSADFQDLPAGAQLWVGLNPIGGSTSTLQAVLTAGETGPLSPIASGGLMGGLPAAQLSVTYGSATAVWEVTASNPAAIDNFDFPVWVVFPSGSSPSGTLTIQGSLAPNPDSGAFNSSSGAAAQGSSFPIPRFVSEPPPAGPTAAYLSPSSGSGASQTFALLYADPLGATDLTSVWVWFTPNFNSASAANSCMLYYAQATNQLFFLNDAGTAWSSPVAPGTALTLSNSQCSINVAGASVTSSGADLTLNLPVTFTAAYAGTKSTYMYAAGSSANSGWQLMGSWTVPSTVAVVSDVSVAPNSGSGLQQTFALQYADSLGATDLTSVWVWFTSNFNTGSAANSCMIYYARATNQLFFLNDAGTAWSSPMAPGTAVTLSNSQCSVNVAAASVTASGTNLTLNLPVTFTTAYDGAKSTYLYAAGSSANSGWQALGSWTVPVTSEVVSDVSVAPNSGSGFQQTFALQYADSLGATDLTSVWGWFTSNFNSGSANSCMIYYARATNQLYFLNDAGTAWSTPVAPGTAVTLSNSQCSVNVAAATVTSSGADLSLNLPVTFTAAYAGAKSTYMYAAGSSANSGWQTLGSWTVSVTSAVVSDVSVAPSSGSATPQTFALQYADSLGAADLTSVWVWFTANFNSAANSCMIYYARATNQLFFLNDAGAAWSAPVAPGTAVTLSNSQCSVNVAAASVTVSGTNLTLNLPVTFTAAYAGAKSTYMYAAGSSANSGWQTLGSWTVPATVAVVSDVSVAPNSGSGFQQTFALQYADSLGAADLTSVWVWFTANFNSGSAASSCMIYYARPSNQLFFLNDSGTTWSSPVAPGAAVTLSNSQCSVNVAAASVTVSGTNLTLNLPVTFLPAYAGAQSTYMYAAGSSANSGWQALGSWTP
jgi:phage baseplate assembly protein gpV